MRVYEKFTPCCKRSAPVKISTCIQIIYYHYLMSLSCGQAAVGIIANSLAAKLSMSLMWRKPTTDTSQFKTTAYKNHSSAQLNEAEYAPSAFCIVFSFGFPLVFLWFSFHCASSSFSPASPFFLFFPCFPFLSSLFLVFVSSLFSISLSFRHSVGCHATLPSQQ